MARYETRSWPADPSAPGGRAERRAFRYRVFFPDPIAKLQPALPSGVAAAVSVSERAVDALNRDPPRLASLEVLARRLLRAESVASSRIKVWSCRSGASRAPRPRHPTPATRPPDPSSETSPPWSTRSRSAPRRNPFGCMICSRSTAT